MYAALMLGLAVLLGYDLTARPAWQTVLPDELAEISGHAFTPDGRLYAHGDELGVIYRLEPRGGRVLGWFTVAPTGRDPNLGRKQKGAAFRLGAVSGDFEDIAIVGDRFFLVSSNGVLLEFRQGRDGGQVPYQTHTTGLTGKCEIEGLAHDASTRSLLLLCKNPRGKGKETSVELYAWSLKTGRVATEPRLSVPYAALAQATGVAKFNGSAIAANPNGKSFLLVAGPQQTFAEVDRSGRVLRGGRFARGVYRQPEGAAFAPDGSVLISSEAAGGRATIAGYVPATR
ncbi:MAG TPA: hypothetical protein VFM14_14225 [Gemmatimonadales bacterium]|nr:hypothetical protein [Gemmatimonadales bacterium]